MKILSKQDVELFISRFEQFSNYDSLQQKHYFVIDVELKIYTLMKYQSGEFTLHSKSKNHCDPFERVIEETEFKKFIWKHRKHIHKQLEGVN